MLQLDDPRPPRSDEAVLGRDEEGVQQDQRRDAEELEEEIHGPTPGAGTRRFLVHQLGRSIGNGPGVPVAAGAAEDDEPLEVRQRFGDGEAPLDGRERAPKRSCETS